MTEAEAWETLFGFADRAELKIGIHMTVGTVRRTLAKSYHPRKVGDDDRAMRQINACIDVIEAIRDQQELCGLAEPTPTGSQPWQTDPADPGTILRNDYSDLNYIRKTIHERSLRFGSIELVKAWGWDGEYFRKVISVMANEWAMEELGRALAFFQTRGERADKCAAVFLTQGSGRATHFRLILIQVGRACEDVSKCGYLLDCQPDDPRLSARVREFLDDVQNRLWGDLTPRKSIESIVETCLYCDDLESARHFYEKVLGLTVIGIETGRHLFFQVGSSVLLLFNPSETIAGETLPSHGAIGPGHVALGVPLDDLQSWRSRLSQHAVTIEKEMRWPRGGRSVYFRDPAGNSIELVTPGIWGLSVGW